MIEYDLISDELFIFLGYISIGLFSQALFLLQILVLIWLVKHLLHDLIGTAGSEMLKFLYI